MLKSCDSDQICTIHRIVTFESKSLERDGIKQDYTKNSQTVNSINTQNTSKTNTKPKTVIKDFYRIPTRNKHGDIEVLTLLKDNVPSVNKLLIQPLKKNSYHTKSLYCKMHLSIKNKTKTRTIT